MKYDNLKWKPTKAFSCCFVYLINFDILKDNLGDFLISIWTFLAPAEDISKGKTFELPVRKLLDVPKLLLAG